MTTFEPLFDHRARLEQMQFEAAARRERSLIDQRSPENSPEVRVRIGSGCTRCDCRRIRRIR